MNNGYIKIHRCLMAKGYYKDSEYVHLWLHLIMKATYQEKEFLFNNKIEHLKPGQFITGRNTLVQETGINRSKIERILKCFESEHQIEQQTNNKFRIITILNWCEYQQDEQENEQPVSNKRAASEQPVSTNNKEKKEKNINNNINTAEKILFLDSVLLTEQEHKKLLSRYGPELTEKSIEVLNNAIMSKGYKYKSHYHTLLLWPMKEAQGGNNGTNRFTRSKQTVVAKTGGAQSDGTPWPADREY